MKKVFYIILTLLLTFSTFQLSAQQDIVRCYAAEADEALRQKYGLGSIQDFEDWLAPLVRQQKLQGSAARATVTLPVVFHVIHDNDGVGTGDNLAATYINAQLEQLNNDFRKITGTSGDNSNPVGADSEIEFCMAAVDPQGNSMTEPGINRIDRNTLGWNAPPYGSCRGPFGLNLDYIENTIKPESQWDPNDYINIWVMDLDCGLLGYAQFPSNSGLGGLNTDGGLASTDGVVVITGSVGSTTNPNPNPISTRFDAGRTLTHELGHFFGLRHIWGDATCGNDYCADTPTQEGASSGCPTTTTCDGNLDMVENYMDYSDDDCMNIFTVDQKARMQTVMANSPRRGSLINSTACSGTSNISPVASFSFNATDLQVSFDGSGSSDSDGTIAAYSWDFGDGNTGTGVTATHTYAAAGTYTVTLTVTDDLGATGTDQQSVSVTAPTSGEPVASFTFSTTDLIADFDASGSSDSDGTIVAYSWNFGDGNTGTGVTTTHTYAAAGSYTVTLTVTDNDTNTGTDQQTVSVTAPGADMYVQSIVLTTNSQGRGQHTGVATVTIVDNNGNPVSNATVTGTFSGSLAETVSGNTDASGTVVLETTSTKQGGNVNFGFCVDDATHPTLTYNSALNNLTCTGAGARTDNSRTFAEGEVSLRQYPNPVTNKEAIFEFSLSQSSLVRLSILNVNGQLMKAQENELQEGNHKISMELNLSSGMYFYVLRTDDSIQGGKMIIKNDN